MLGPLSPYSPKPPCWWVCWKRLRMGSGSVIWCCHSHPISTFCSNWPKFREIQEFDTLDLGIPTVAFILILMVPLHAGLNSNMAPQDFLLCSPGLWLWWDIMSMLMLLYMEKKGGGGLHSAIKFREVTLK